MTTNNATLPKIDKPHDKLVWRLLSNITAAREILEAYLPADVKKLLDLDYFERQPNSFVDAQHRFLEPVQSLLNK
jgi:predicted transposase YdaD